MRSQDLCAGLAAAAVAMAAQASADVIYTNGPANGTIEGNLIDNTSYTWEPFTVTSNWEVSSIEVSLWAGRFTNPAGGSLDWGLSELGPTDIGTAQLTVVDGPNAAVGSYVYYDLTFDLNVALTPGTWYLTLQKATPFLAWDINDGPSKGTEYYAGGYLSTPGNAFTVYGTPLVISGPGNTPAPEPGAWSLMILGVGATGAVLRARRRFSAG
ncbi:MAG TPA: PEP-CTERM sorting domain-containing protein [Caulobacteraceae bacterium]|jgi:hypothetical protein|nr:PEP-CTERM sorting domain-containing protein [Caulobacteraceae bacterium]